jgi:hypothetical protein
MPEGESEYGRRANLLVGFMVANVLVVFSLAIYLRW